MTATLNSTLVGNSRF